MLSPLPREGKRGTERVGQLLRVIPLGSDPQSFPDLSLSLDGLQMTGVGGVFLLP